VSHREVYQITYTPYSVAVNVSKRAPAASLSQRQMVTTWQRSYNGRQRS